MGDVQTLIQFTYYFKNVLAISVWFSFYKFYFLCRSSSCWGHTPGVYLFLLLHLAFHFFMNSWKDFFPKWFFLSLVFVSLLKKIYFIVYFWDWILIISSGWPCPHSPALALKVFATIPSSFSCLESWKGELLLSLPSLADEKVSYDHTRMNTLGRCR